MKESSHVAIDTGLLVKRIRQSMEISIAELARRCNLSRNYLSMIERGQASNISIDIASKLSSELSKANIVKNQDINLNDYPNVPLSNMIIWELNKDSLKKAYSSKNPHLQTIIDNARYATEEIKLAAKQSENNRLMELLSLELKFLNQLIYDLLNRSSSNNLSENIDYSELMVWLLSNTDTKYLFNDLMKSSIDSSDEHVSIDCSIVMLKLIREAIVYKANPLSNPSFKVINT